MSAPKQTLSHLPLALVPSEAMQKRAEKYQFLFPFQEVTFFNSIQLLKCQIIFEISWNTTPLQSSLKLNIRTLCFMFWYCIFFEPCQITLILNMMQGVVPNDVQRMVHWVRWTLTVTALPWAQQGLWPHWWKPLAAMPRHPPQRRHNCAFASSQKFVVVWIFKSLHKIEKCG